LVALILALLVALFGALLVALLGYHSHHHQFLLLFRGLLVVVCLPETDP